MLERGQRVRLPDESGLVVVRDVVPRDDGVDLFVARDVSTSDARVVPLTLDRATQTAVVVEDGSAPPTAVLAGLWNEWMLGATSGPFDKIVKVDGGAVPAKRTARRPLRRYRKRRHRTSRTERRRLSGPHHPAMSERVK